MDSAQRKQFNKKVAKVSAQFEKAIAHVIDNYDADTDAITVADLRYILAEMKESK